ncbi:hypothetical protein CGRA01v4_11428 [Colletotrichum graminicola]|nr:hypothetical protein CGRA01v4_11428 [Colletotrichum graminicola]
MDSRETCEVCQTHRYTRGRARVLASAIGIDAEYMGWLSSPAITMNEPGNSRSRSV